MALATFTFDSGSAGAVVGSPLSPDSGSGYKLLEGDTNAGKYNGSTWKVLRSVIGNSTAPLWYIADGSSTYIGDGDASTRWVDCYYYIPSAPGSTKWLIYGLYFTNAGLAITSDRRFALTSATDSSVLTQTASNTVPLNAWFRVAVRFTTNGAQEARIVTSSAGDATTADYVLTADCGVGGYLALAVPQSSFFDELTVQDGSATGIPSAGATTHEASASLTVTASRTATAARTQFPTSTATTTATTTAAATVERIGAASQTVTATTTATATTDLAAAGTSTVTATITASADVTGSSSGDAALAATATVTASAVVERMASAALSVAAAITATLINEDEVTPGTMRALTIEGATMRPAGSTGATMRVGLLGLNAATMTAVVSDEGTPTTIGVPVFAGPTDPVTAGLITAGTPHVWFHDGTVFVQE